MTRTFYMRGIRELILVIASYKTYTDAPVNIAADNVFVFARKAVKPYFRGFLFEKSSGIKWSFFCVSVFVDFINIYPGRIII